MNTYLVAVNACSPDNRAWLTSTYINTELLNTPTAATLVKWEDEILKELKELRPTLMAVRILSFQKLGITNQV